MMHGLVSVDMTSTLDLLKAEEPPRSVTALVIAAVARTVAQHPEVHAYRSWNGQLVVPRYVDVATLVESSTSAGLFPLAHLIENADVRSVSDISRELRSVAGDPSSSPSGRFLPWVERTPVPGLLIRALYRMALRSRSLRRVTGTVTVSAVGMFGGGGGHGIGVPTVSSLTILVGGLSRRPWLMDDEVVARDVLDLTISADHAVVDGAPLARFGADLRRILETAGEWLPEDG